MVGFLANFGTAFVLGLLTPLTAVCVLPLYPAFLAYLSNKLGKAKLEGAEGTEPEKADNRRLLILFGIIITLGVVVFMFLLGLIFTTLFSASLTKVIGIISPIAFGILALISIFLIFDVDIGKYLPKMKTPAARNPLVNAFLFGFFFGAIVIPCNPLFIAALFARTVTVMSFGINILNFIAFGLGIGFPLLLFSAISATASTGIIGFLTNHKKAINRIAGSFMLIVSLYYLTCVFSVFGDVGLCGLLI